MSDNIEMLATALANLGEQLKNNNQTRKPRLHKDIAPTVSELMNATQWHGLNGIFGQDCALDRSIITNMVTPFGLMSVLPVVTTQEELVRQGAITGFNPDQTSEPDYPCENAPRGTYTTCRLEYVLGRIKRDSNTIEIDEAIKKAHRGDSDFQLVGGFIGDSLGNLGTGRLRDASPAQILNVVTLSEMQGIGIQFARELSTMLWSGDPTAGPPQNTPNGGKRSFQGLDLWINAGITDAESGAECPAMDSGVYDFAFDPVCEDDTDVVPFSIVQVLAGLEHRVRNIARGSQLDPVQWVVAMHPNLWQELSACYPCLYHTDRCIDPVTEGLDSTIVRFNDNYSTQQRDAYRNGGFLPINGTNYPVITDFGIPELNFTLDAQNLIEGQYASSIYFVPLSIRGGFPVTFLRYLDYRASAMDVAQLNGQSRFWTDDGRFMWATEFVNFCYEITGKIEPGLVFRTPQLAFRIDDVMYQPAFPLRNPYPGHQDYLT